MGDIRGSMEDLVTYTLDSPKVHRLGCTSDELRYASPIMCPLVSTCLTTK